MKFVWVIALILALLFGLKVAGNFIGIVVVGAFFYFGINAAYWCYQGFKKRQWGSGILWGIGFIIWLLILF